MKVLGLKCNETYSYFWFSKIWMLEYMKEW